MLAELNVIEGPYLKDIFEQPQALTNTLRHLVAPSPELIRITREAADGGYRRIILTGMGSSLFALYDLYLSLISRGHSAVLIETSELVHSLPGFIGDSDLIVAVSQSGRSAELLRLLSLRPERAALVGVTNDLNSPLAAEATACVPIHAGPESTVSCKTYVSSLAALQVLRSMLSGQDAASACRALESAPEAAAQYLSDWRQHVATAGDLVSGIRNIFVTGRASSISTAQTGGLILKESVRFPAEGMSSAAFRHGPFEMLSNQVLVVIMEGDGRSAPLNRRLAADAKAARARVALVSPDAEPGPFRIPNVPDAVKPIVEILPVQMISLALGALQGREAGRFELATKVTAVE